MEQSMYTMRVTALLGVLSLAACRTQTETRPQRGFVKVRDCQGPALSLDPALAATVLPRSGRDGNWGDLAEKVPGGFAGILFDKDGSTPIIMLTRPHEAEQAKAALAGQLPAQFPLASAVPRQARWDFAQLLDWFNYFNSKVTSSGMVSADKDEQANRIRYGVIADSTRRRLVQALHALNIPCDLVLIGIESGIQLR
jgi:hypothetical protein